MKRIKISEKLSDEKGKRRAIIGGGLLYDLITHLADLNDLLDLAYPAVAFTLSMREDKNDESNKDYKCVCENYMIASRKTTKIIKKLANTLSVEDE